MAVWSLAALLASGCFSADPGPALPRTADGKPNLQGVWQVRNAAAFGLEDHVARHGMLAGRSVVEGRTIPYLPDAAKQRVELAVNPQNDPLSKCYMPGVPRIMYMPFPFHIYQTPEHIAITFEWSQVHRTIHTNGVPGPDGIDFWMGDSRGRWEGDTLVVRTTNFTDKTASFSPSVATAVGSGATLTLIERFRRADATTLHYEFTVEDSSTFTRPFTALVPMQKSDQPVFEYACHEGNYGLMNVLRGARAEDAQEGQR
jgi:hypothetical protein